jgi:hypothetical protein
MKDFSDEQEKLFRDWVSECGALLDLKGFIQNDFKRLFDDGYLTKEELEANLKNFRNHYPVITSNVESLRLKIEALCLKVIEDF